MDGASSQFRLTSFVWESQPGRYVLTVVAHATAKLVQGQEAHWSRSHEDYPLGYDDAQAASARMNLVAPFKPRADVVVVGKAYAPPGSDADRLLARLRIADFAKAVSVTGDRLWMRNEAGRWGSSAPRPFSQMLLSGERSLRSAENPAGLDPAGLPVEGRLALPNLEPVAGSYSAVLGPVPPSAPSRRNLLSPHAVAWVGALEMGRAPGPVVEGLNFGFFNLAPADQQLAEITPGSAVVLENLNATHSMFTSRLPSTVPRVRGTDPASGRPIEPQLRCDTLWIDGDREIAWLVFRGTVDLMRPDLPVSLSLDVERWQPAATLTPSTTQSLLLTQAQTATTSGPPLPFAGPRGPAFGVYAQPDPRLAPSFGSPAAGAVRDEITADLPEKGSYPPPPGPKRSITSEILVDAQNQALPFGGADWDSTGDLEVTNTAGLPRQDTAEIESATPIHPARSTEPPPPPSMPGGLPFGSQSPNSVHASGPPSVTALLDRGRETAVPETLPRKRLSPRGSPGPIPEIGETPAPELPADLEPDAPPAMLGRGPSVLDIQAPPPPLTAEPAGVASVSATEPGSEPAMASELSDPTPPAPAVGPPLPPPSTSVDLDDTPLPDAPEAAAEASAPSAPPVAPAPEPPPAPEPEPLREQLSLEEAAAVRAELSQKGADKSAVFERFRLLDSAWPKIEREHLMAIDEANKSGDSSLLERYDDAFVSAQDRLRTAIDGLLYARLSVARETGQIGQVLEELGVARGDLMRLDRVWRRRLSSDAGLRERVEDEMERLRGEAG